MRLDQELVQRKLCGSRTEAQELITSGLVFVEGIVTTKKTKKVENTTEIEVKGKREFVSRGGNKLQGVLVHLYKNNDAIAQFFDKKIALDIGSSTGGFTDCLLRYGIASVDAVDVGTNQLHTKIREDKKVTSYENTDIRTFKGNKSFYDIIVADLSFIPLENVIDTIINFGKKGTTFFLLIKPQFEVGKGNTKKGIVKEQNLVDAILLKYRNLVEEKGLQDIQIITSSIQGGDGNQEYFLYGVL